MTSAGRSGSAAKPPSPPGRGDGRRRHLFAAVAGFVAGVAFWHIVGFWSFVGQVVVRGPETARVQTMAPLSPGSWFAWAQTAIGDVRKPPPVANCDVAVLDRASRAVALRPCERGTNRIEARSGVSHGRADRLRFVAERE